MATDPQTRTHPQTGPITIHCTAKLSVQCNEFSVLGRMKRAMTVGGRLFHAVAAATENARSPSDDLLVAGTTSAGELDDLRPRLGSA